MVPRDRRKFVFSARREPPVRPMPHPMVRRLLSLLWPHGEPGLKARVIAAVGLVAAAKLISIGAPLLYKQAIDALSSPALAVVPVALILAYGVAQVGAQAAGALRQLVFARVAQRAIRLTAL